MTDLRQWRQFVAVAEELHFGRAALRLHMTQPPLTVAIRQLEAALGTPLFDRTRRSVALTPAGQAALPPARKLLADAQALADLARAAARGVAGRLRLGFVSTIGYGALPQWLSGFRKAHPEIEVALQEATLDVQLQAFAAGELDAGFVLHAPGAPPEGFERLAVLREPLVLAVPSAHPLAGRARLRAAQVLREPVVIFPRHVSPSLYDALLSFYSAAQAVPHIGQEAIQMQTIVNLVSAGMGVAWVPASMTRLQRPGVVYLRCTGALQCETSLVWPAGPLPVVDRFVEFVRAHAVSSNNT
jgi:DNA-binding transcriptional LysR family regulator